MIPSIFRFELAYQMRGAGFIAVFALFFLLVFGAVTVDQLQIGSSDAVNINSPSAAATTISIMSIFGLFIPVVFMATGVTRDASLKTAEVFGSLPVSPRAMMIGRYFGGLLASCLCFFAVPLAFYIGSFMPWLDQEQVGPHSFFPVLYYYLVFGVLNMLIIGTLMFTVANMTRSMIATWVALVTVLVGYFVGLSMAGEMEAREFAALLDPFGIVAHGEVTRYWTAAERNTQVAELSGLFLQNRLIWGGVALALFAFNLAFPSGIRGPSLARFKKPSKSPLGAELQRVKLPRVEPAPLYTSNLQQFFRRLRFETAGIVRSVAFWIVLVLSILNTVGALFFLQNMYGSSSYPLTRLMVNQIEGAFAFVPIVIAVYYTAELVWRERTVKFNEIIDATPTPSWVFVGAKYATVIFVLILMCAVATLTAVISQVVRGYTLFELDQYAVRLFFTFVVNFGLLTTLALFVQVVTNNKWLGIGVILAYFVVSIVMSQVGFDHILYTLGGGIEIVYSDMNRYGPYMLPTVTMSIYWGLFAVILGLITFALWSRGSLDPIRHRIGQIPNRLKGGSAAALGLATVAFAGTGAWVFYNTNVLNTYRTDEMNRDRQQAFEEKYRQFQFAPRPQIVSVDVDVELFPDDRRMVGTTEYLLENTTDAPIERMDVDYGFNVNVIDHTVEGARLAEADEEFAHYVFRFEPALQPGEKRTMISTVEIDNEGFRNSGQNSPVRRNGTFLNSGVFAAIDWGQDKILTDRSERRKRGLDELPRVPAIDDPYYINVGLLGGADWVDFRAEITTDADQIAIAPGYLAEERLEGDRKTFVYEQDVPIQNFYSVQSARYEVSEDVWEAPDGMDDIKLQVFYDDMHPFNVDRMIEAMKLSFDKFTEVFTPFQYRQMRIQEFPYASFAQSFPNTVPYSENIGFIIKLDESNPDAIDPVTYVTAHEVAHQWFGHQLSAASVQGSTMLIETFAQYAALLVMEDLYGPEHMRRFLRYELDSYLSGRANEPIEEMPLYLVENQQYIHYRKGSIVMWLLKDQIGEDVVNRSLKRMIEEWGYRSDPYPRSTDYLAILRDEAGPEHEELIHDLFERIVLWDVDVTDATAEQRADGKWDVTLTVDAKKLVADGAGNETEEPLSMMMDVGVFSKHPREVKDGNEHILAFERQEIVSGKQTITLTVDEEPAHGGVDPYNKLIDRRPENNISKVERTEDAA
ncbi:ABC transporter permease/M1 family aminopeptidase [Parvularcula lutaonensis]|uniref:M1 family aminopeptidase n=1 Tax=Parvularcula lutaonensis TaxID=491923 RepID=A0ABV7MEK1_9PROT|nr:M1 family aminopeptidase [Parvularcula lutaonensis]GGY55673.1 hypothetical protein GCM10007148_26970 [Parvularcula lutaonensis]